jgi:UPF0755 protein
VSRDRRAGNRPSPGSGGRAGGRHNGRSDRYPVPDERYDQDGYGPADSYAGQDDYDWDSGYSASDVRDAYARDAYARAGGHAPADGRGAGGGYPPEDDYPPPDDGYAPADRYAPVRGQDAYGPEDGYQDEGSRYDEPDGYPPNDGYAGDDYPRHDQYQPDYGPGGADQDDLYVDDDEHAGYQNQNGYHEQDRFGWHQGAAGDEPDDPRESPGAELPGYARGTPRPPQGPGPDNDEAAGWDDEPPSQQGFIPGLAGGRDPEPGKKRRRPGRVIAPVLALVLLVVVAVGGYEGYKQIHLRSADYSGPGTGHVTVQVQQGDTATSLAPRLVRLGVIASVNSFVAAAKDSNDPSGLQPGFFSLRHHMNSALAYQLLTSSSSRVQTVVTIPEGLRMTQILSLLQQKLGHSVPANAFSNAIKDTAALGLPSYANGNPEGYLFPATYDIQPGATALSVLQTMVAKYTQEAASLNLSSGAQAGQMTPAQVITVASILEAEGSPKYYAEIAEVIYNRLNDGMDLGLDSTVNYALNRFGVSLTQSQLQTNSPYNTFIHAGLPPGPIDSPGDAAIQAALHPDHGDETYFVTVNLQSGLTLFTNSPTQFAQYVQECQQNNAC